MEIERKFLVREVPGRLSAFTCLVIEQAYLCTSPVVRIRRQNEEYYLTYKGKGLMAREEYNLPLDKESYGHLLAKADGNIISKKRYLIPIDAPAFSSHYKPAGELPSLTVELDIFEPPFAPLILAEVEFPDVETADAFLPPPWLGEDVTTNVEYHNSNMSRKIFSNTL
ncbi:MAG: CYTH domain-containing protein [Lachnospiraceae bacterium]|nr:CYTH domain-containing protein [Lachnospiraceae bacterium]